MAVTSSQEKRQRKQHVLTHKNPSQVQSIADALVIKDEDVFFLCERDGQVPLRGRHGFGLYYHDCRFLSGYAFKLAGKKPSALIAAPRKGSAAVLELINPGFRAKNGRLVQKEDVGINWQRLIDATRLMLHDHVSFENFSLEPVDFEFSFTYRAEFEDSFVVRGMLAERLGKLHSPSWKHGALNFMYDGSDGLFRSVQIHFSPQPDSTEETTAHFQVKLKGRETKDFRVAILLAESPNRNKAHARPPSISEVKQIEASQHSASDDWLENQTGFHSDSRSLNEIMERSLSDLRLLRSRLNHDEFFAAGIPWFSTLFGRDSLIAALQTLAYEPQVAEHTLRLLAGYQGTKVDEWRDEQPGKILHELRVGELAHRGEIPHTPYYGSIDSTPLFLILLCEHAAWTGKLDLFQELRDNVERALEWMAKYGDHDGDGYLEYRCTSDSGLINQGWKDSGNAIVNADGSLARPPIALIEVQAYAYLARVSLADLFERAGEADRAAKLRKDARTLQVQVNRDFWMKDKRFYALALQQDQEPVSVISSNPGHALWTGIVDEEKARNTVDRLMAEDVFSGWGVRTLSMQERRYNPVGYHLGTVWPHDNSLIVAGFRSYGFDDAARHMFNGIMEAAMHFPFYRLPEVFSGFSRKDFGVPVRYAVACHPQAWAAGSVPYMLQTLLGLVPDAFNQRLRIVRPILPDMVDRVELRGLRVGGGAVDLNFRRATDGKTEVETIKTTGDVKTSLEVAGHSPSA
jgi:glycogen debranching enzyme